MANIITTLATFEGPEESIKPLEEIIENGFDFNAIELEPQSLELPEGGIKESAIQCYQAKQENRKLDKETKKLVSHLAHHKEDDFVLTPELYEIMDSLGINSLEGLGKQYLDNKEKYNASTWYEWRLEHWGTKWPADVLSSNVGPYTQVTFETPWSCPEALLITVAKKYEVSVKVSYYDEDYGSNYGQFDIEASSGALTRRDISFEDVYVAVEGKKFVDEEKEEWFQGLNINDKKTISDGLDALLTDLKNDLSSHKKEASHGIKLN